MTDGKFLKAAVFAMVFFAIIFNFAERKGTPVADCKPPAPVIPIKPTPEQILRVNGKTVVMECTYSDYCERKKIAEEYQNSINCKTRINSGIRSSNYRNQIMNDNGKCTDYKDLVSKVK